MSFHRTSKFRALSAVWEQKLKDSGFKDAENRGIKKHSREQEDTDSLKEYHSLLFRGYRKGYGYKGHGMTSEDMNNVSSYYSELAAFGHRKAWNKRPRRERIIWELYVEGYSLRDISDRLVALRCKPLKKDRINMIIHKLLIEARRELLIWKGYVRGASVEQIKAELVKYGYNVRHLRIDTIIKKLVRHNEQLDE
jgi:hypothetical protein